MGGMVKLLKKIQKSKKPRLGSKNSDALRALPL
jgi:hypothetical protein